jgi:hypothetical protein
MWDDSENAPFRPSELPYEYKGEHEDEDNRIKDI